MFSDETYRAVIVAAIQAHNSTEGLAEVAGGTVDALTAADRKLMGAHAEIRNYFQTQREKA